MNKGFDKPVKYIFMGEPNTTKTTLSGRTGLKVFETDGMLEEELLCSEKYPDDFDIVIIGGKWIKHSRDILLMLETKWKDTYHVIEVEFRKARTNILRFTMDVTPPPDKYGDGFSTVYIATEDKILQVKLDDDDGYRSHADLVPDEEVDGFMFWMKMEGGKNRVYEIEYDEIAFGFKGPRKASWDSPTDFIVQAKMKGDVVFEIGTDNSDDYYPSYIANVKDKTINEFFRKAE